MEKCSDIKFYENPSIGSRVVTCGRMEGWTGACLSVCLSVCLYVCLDKETDMTKVIVAFRNLLARLKNEISDSEAKAQRFFFFTFFLNSNTLRVFKFY
jgi:hypothetical protein